MEHWSRMGESSIFIAKLEHAIGFMFVSSMVVKSKIVKRLEIN